MEGSVLFKEVFEEPNFMDYLVATHTAIHKVIADGIFAKEEEVITPLDGSYNCSDFASVDQWAKEYGWLSDDPEALEQFAAKLRVLANGGTHYVRLYSQDYEVLLRK